MKKTFSNSWSSSKQTRKQRKFRYNAPLHIKHKFVSAHLSKELIKKHQTRSLPVKKGDQVKIVRGQFKNHTGKIEKVLLKSSKVYVEGIQLVKKDGSKVFCRLDPSNLIITVLNLQDKKRQKIIDRRMKHGKKAS